MHPRSPRNHTEISVTVSSAAYSLHYYYRIRKRISETLPHRKSDDTKQNCKRGFLTALIHFLKAIDIFIYQKKRDVELSLPCAFGQIISSTKLFGSRWRRLSRFRLLLLRTQLLRIAAARLCSDGVDNVLWEWDEARWPLLSPFFIFSISFSLPLL